MPPTEALRSSSDGRHRSQRPRRSIHELLEDARTGLTRLDPASDARLPEAALDIQGVIVCDEGYAAGLPTTG